MMYTLAVCILHTLNLCYMPESKPIPNAYPISLSYKLPRYFIVMKMLILWQYRASF